MTDDIVYDDSAWPETMRGKAAVREFPSSTWRAFPDLSFEGVGGAAAGERRPARGVLVERHRLRNTGPIDPPGIPPTGKRIEFEGADFHEYRDGKVARLRIVFDMSDLGRQMGLLPEPGSTGERAMVWMQKLKARAKRS